MTVTCWVAISSPTNCVAASVVRRKFRCLCSKAHLPGSRPAAYFTGENNSLRDGRFLLAEEFLFSPVGFVPTQAFGRRDPWLETCPGKTFRGMTHVAHPDRRPVASRLA